MKQQPFELLLDHSETLEVGAKVFCQQAIRLLARTVPDCHLFADAREKVAAFAAQLKDERVQGAMAVA